MLIIALTTLVLMVVKHNEMVKELKGLNNKVITGRKAQDISLIDNYKDIKVFFEHDDCKDLLS